MRPATDDKREATRTAPLEVSLNTEALLTVHDVADILKVPVSWVYEHTRPECRNPLPHIKLGKYLRFLAADVLDYLAAMKAANYRRRC